MTGPLKDYEEFSAGPLVFPIGGKDYVAPAVGIDDGMVLLGVLDGTDKSLSKLKSNELFKLVLRETWEEMRDDGVPIEAAFRAGMAALADFREGRLAAQAIWESGINPESLAAWTAAKTQELTNSLDSTRSPSTASESPTRSRASTRTTTSRKATPRRGQTKRTTTSRSRGPRSSPNGA